MPALRKARRSCRPEWVGSMSNARRCLVQWRRLLFRPRGSRRSTVVFLATLSRSGTNRFLFGYNIQFGLKATTSIEDVFNVYDYDQESHTFSPVPVEEVLSDSAFQDDFKYLYKILPPGGLCENFMVIGPHLYMGLRIGKGPSLTSRPLSG